MRISQKGVDLIKSFEGLKLKAYKDAVGIPTIGYGHTGIDVSMGDTITEERAEELLRIDLERFEAGVDDYTHIDLEQYQFDALVSLAYNIGLRALKGSTLLKNLNSCDLEKVADNFLQWTRAGKKVLPGLVRRRNEEREMFIG